MQAINEVPMISNYKIEYDWLLRINTVMQLKKRQIITLISNTTLTECQLIMNFKNHLGV